MCIRDSGYHVVIWQPPALWTDQLGQGAVTAVAAGNNGIYVGGHAIFMNRYDLGGQRVWSQEFGNSVYDEVEGIAVGTDGVYVAGFLNGSDVVRKHSFDGSLLWTVKDVGPIISAGTQGVFVVSRSTLLRAYDLNGNPLWTNSLGNRTGTISMTTYSGASHVYLLANWRGVGSLRSYNSDGTLNWKENLTCSCFPTGVAVDASGIYVSGLAYESSAAKSGVLVKYDINGNVVWTKSFDAPDSSPFISSQGMAIGTAGIYVIATSYRQSNFLLRYDNDGNQIWSVQIPITANSLSVGQDAVYVGGVASPNALLSKYSPSSSLILFGVTPPLSFLVLGSLGGVVALSIFWLRRQKKRLIRRPKSAVPYS